MYTEHDLRVQNGDSGQSGIRSIAWMDLWRPKVSFQVDRSFTPIIPGVDRAAGRNGKLLAEARATKLVKSSGPEACKAHFSSCGRVVDECRSFFDSRAGRRMRRMLGARSLSIALSSGRAIIEAARSRRVLREV